VFIFVSFNASAVNAMGFSSCGNASSRRLSGSEEEGASPKRPSRTRTHPHRHNNTNNRTPKKNRYRRDSESPRSDHNSDSESTSHIMPYYRSSSSSESESEDGAIPYAGAKFNSPPPAHMLPTPPISWISTSTPTSPRVEQVNLSAMSSHLRQMLKVTE